MTGKPTYLTYPGLVGESQSPRQKIAAGSFTGQNAVKPRAQHSAALEYYRKRCAGSIELTASPEQDVLAHQEIVPWKQLL